MFYYLLELNYLKINTQTYISLGLRSISHYAHASKGSAANLRLCRYKFCSNWHRPLNCKQKTKMLLHCLYLSSKTFTADSTFFELKQCLPCLHNLKGGGVVSPNLSMFLKPTMQVIGQVCKGVFCYIDDIDVFRNKPRVVDTLNSLGLKCKLCILVIKTRVYFTVCHNHSCSFFTAPCTFIYLPVFIFLPKWSWINMSEVISFTLMIQILVEIHCISNLWKHPQPKVLLWAFTFMLLWARSCLILLTASNTFKVTSHFHLCEQRKLTELAHTQRAPAHCAIRRNLQCIACWSLEKVNLAEASC